MARFTFPGNPPRVSFPSGGEYVYSMRVNFGSYAFKEENSEGVCIAGIAVKRVEDFNFRPFDYPCQLQRYVLQPGEDAKLPPLPRGVKLYDPDPNQESDGACKVLALDWEYYVEFVTRALIEHFPFGHTPDDRRAAWITFWGQNSSNLQSQIACSFDFACPDDRYTKFTRTDDYYALSFYDSTTPWLSAKSVNWADHLSDPDGGGIGELEHKWQNEIEYVYEERLDANMVAAPLTRFRKAFGCGLHSETGGEHRQYGRKIAIEEETRVPFPEECMFEQWGTTFLAFNIDRQGRYLKPKGFNFWLRDCVFIHRQGTYTRFLFWEHRVMSRTVSERLRYVAMYAAVVADSECSRTMPVSPMRGMDPNVTRAVAGNPYFASAFQHAINRRKYLQTKMPEDRRCVFDVPGEPILIRADSDLRLRGGLYSKVGRRTTRAVSFACDRQTKEIVSGLGANDLLFETVQPVAQEPVSRRALVLDM